MKKLLLIPFICMTVISCKKNILDISPTDRISENALWTDEKLPQLFINAQYNALQSGFQDDVQYFCDDSYSQYDLGGYQLIASNALTSSNVTSLSGHFNYWKTAYSYLHNLAIFFDKIDATPISAEVKKQMIAEVKFLRAFIYAKLIWNYGGVPIIDKAFALSEELTGVKRNSYDECVQYILKDLNDAIATLPDQQTGAYAGHASADAARALKARVLLYYASPLNNPQKLKQRWQEASDAALELINGGHYSLSDNFHGLFTGGQNNEAIFSRYYSTDVSHNIGFYCAPVGSGGYGQRDPSQTLVDAFEMTNGVIPVIDGVVNPDPKNTYDQQNPYINRDPRFYATVLYNGAMYKGRTIEPYKGGDDFTGNDATQTGYYLNKFIDENLPVSKVTPYTYPWVYFRLAEVYLNYAEAQYNLGNEAQARLYVNKVRERPGVNMPPIKEAGVNLFDRIVHERQVELAMEGLRYYDVRRWEIAPQTETQPIQGMEIQKKSDGSFQYTRLNLLKRIWDDKLYLLPISFQEVQASGESLEQNPGY